MYSLRYMWLYTAQERTVSYVSYYNVFMEQNTNQISGFQYFFYTVTTSLILILSLTVLYYKYVHIPNLTSENVAVNIFEPIDESSEIKKTLQNIEEQGNEESLSDIEINSVLKRIREKEEESVELTKEEREMILSNVYTSEE